ncbi:MAG: tRNA (guanosine(46)-N7)-methyltransferase TrmB [Flavobacteriaceae bacterium]|nr:tRNA (guanosine(46)-N7)-methyltransferase TrmB [Flavobacteriaceae bacterium]
MGSKNKRKRFKENETFSHVIQPSREDLLTNDFALKGQWHNRFFGNSGDLVLELGCGKGEYSVAMAEMFPMKNFVGVDIKGARFWRGAKTAQEKSLSNVCFLRTQIELIDKAFAPGEVSEIWITFPDPQIKYKRTKHRMTNPDFLEKYRSVLKPGGLIHLKTDSEFMHGYTLGLLQGLGHEICYAHHHVYNNPESPSLVTQVQTFYEKQYLAQEKPITYICFKLRP